MSESFHVTDSKHYLSLDDMTLVEGGCFQMGGSDKKASKSEQPLHEVQVSPFLLSKYLVTQEFWTKVMKSNPSNFIGKDRPVERVSWNECKRFLYKLNGIFNKQYRLPTEAEWEYAARGGINSENYLYAGSDKLQDVGWYNKNSGGETKPVGQKMSNELGIYDLSGNVWEWCEDNCSENYSSTPQNGSAFLHSGTRRASRVYRGGGWLGDSKACRLTARNHSSPGFRSLNIGFRLTLSLSP